MEPITSNDFLNSVLETEAWKEVSQSGSLSMTMIEKFADKLDWEEVSGNRNIIWTVEGINKFANKIHWDEFSRSCPENLLSELTLQKFASKWDWKALSNRDDIYNNWRLLEKFADKVNWGEVITNWNIGSRLSSSHVSNSTYPCPNFRTPVCGMQWSKLAPSI